MELKSSTALVQQPEPDANGRISLFHPDFRNRITVDPDTGKLYWDDREIFAGNAAEARNTESQRKVLIAAVAGLFLVCGAAALLMLQKNVCLFGMGSCTESTLSLGSDAIPAVATESAIDFETTNPFSQGDTSNFSLEPSAAKSGGLGLHAAGNGAFAAIYDGSTTYNAADGVKVSAWVKPISTGDEPQASLVGLSVGNSSDDAKSGYSAMLDLRSGGSLQLRKDFDYDTRDQQTVSLTSGAWYWLEVTWTSGSITAELLDGPGGTSLATVTKSDSTYSSGHVGIVAFDAGDFDDVSISP